MDNTIKAIIVASVRKQLAENKLLPKHTCTTLEEIRVWVEEHPENKPHIITKSNDEELIIIY